MKMFYLTITISILLICSCSSVESRRNKWEEKIKEIDIGIDLKEAENILKPKYYGYGIYSQHTWKFVYWLEEKDLSQLKIIGTRVSGALCLERDLILSNLKRLYKHK